MLHQQPIENMRTTHVYKRVITTLSVLWYALFVQAQEGKLSGTVRNENEPLPAATVSVGNRTLLTDQDGKFSLSLTPGAYTLTITHAGYKKNERQVNIVPGTTQDLDFLMIAIDQLDEVTLGSRSLTKRNFMNRPVPIDVISAKQLQQTGQISLSQMLTFIAPSFNSSREILNEPATLRGFDPQHLLILCNNIRYHNMAWYFGGNLKGQLGRGSVGNDLNSIPLAAIEEIEILRDGASAQYGSDAIAGILNIKLKKTTGKTSIQVNTGQFYNKDGDKFSFGVYHGISLGKKNRPEGRKGFLGLGTNYRYQEPTFHGGTYGGTVYYDTTGRPAMEKDSLLNLDNKKVAERGFDRRKAVDNVGNSTLISYGLSINGGYDLNDKTKIFWTATMNERIIKRLAAYRFPKFPRQVNHFLYPDGFQSINKTSTIDGTGIAGIKGETKSNWQWNFVSSYGINSLKSYSLNSNNPTQTYTLGNNAQTSFYSGNDIFKLLTTGINFSKQINKHYGQIKLLNLAWGTEWRFEKYVSKIGEEASWKNYDPVNYPQFGQGASENIINKNRNVLGAYIEIETEPAKRLLVNIATRYEYYSDFGGNLGAKLAALYKLSNKFSIRTSVNNGFRAPSLQQRYITSVQIVNISSGGILRPVYRGLFSNEHVIAKAFEIPSLTAEKTINISTGVTASILKNISLMIDAYWIQIKNRIILSGTLDRTIPDVRKILDSIPGIRVDQVQFFTNAINTRTKGVDIALNGKWNINKCNLGFMFAANFTKTSLFGEIKATDKLPVNTINSNSLFNTEERTRMEHGQPAIKIILSITGKKGKTGFALNNTRFGKTKTATLFDAKSYIFLHESFSSKILTDISIYHDLKKWLTLTIGANNVFNVYPDRIKNVENTLQGSYIYSPKASPFGFNGGYYFLNMSFNF